MNHSVSHVDQCRGMIVLLWSKDVEYVLAQTQIKSASPSLLILPKSRNAAYHLTSRFAGSCYQ